MRWFSTEEVCEILGRFSKVIIVGDSMMRHIIGSLNVLMRKDLGYGAVTDWNFSPDERYAFPRWPRKGTLLTRLDATASVITNSTSRPARSRASSRLPTWSKRTPPASSAMPTRSMS